MRHSTNVKIYSSILISFCHFFFPSSPLTPTPLPPWCSSYPLLPLSRFSSSSRHPLPSPFPPLLLPVSCVCLHNATAVMISKCHIDKRMILALVRNIQMQPFAFNQNQLHICFQPLQQIVYSGRSCTREEANICLSLFWLAFNSV